jgi:hypothetical protein
MFSLLHYASLRMQSDDDLNKAVVLGCAAWPLFILLSGWLGNELFLRRTKLTSVAKVGYVVSGGFWGVVTVDLLIGLSIKVCEWPPKISVTVLLYIVALIWLVGASLGALVAKILLSNYLYKKTGRP